MSQIPLNLINPLAIVVLKYCPSCKSDWTTGELTCSCGTKLVTVVHSAVDGRRITAG